MITLDLACIGFMDSDPVPRNSVDVELAVTPRFFVPPPREAEPEHGDPETRLYADFAQATTFRSSGLTDDAGRVRVQFDVDDAWKRTGSRTHGTLGRARDVVGFVTTKVNVASMDLFSGHRVVLARSPQSAVTATVIVDPAKLIIGHTTTSSARILCWLHAAPLPHFRFQLIRRGGGGDDRRTVAISNDDAHVGTTTYTGLAANTTYTVTLIARDTRTLDEHEIARGEFRTRPRNPTTWTIDFASCHLPTDAASLRPWALQANRTRADLLMLLGDQIYGDAVPELTPGSWSWLHRYVYRYERLWTYQPMRKVLRQTPTVAIFDDHEVVDDWGVAGVDEIGAARMRGALAAYDRFQGNLNPPTPVENQFDFGFTDGKVAVYVLDERSRRGGGGGHNVLGSAQFARFRRWCRSPATLAADVVVVGSSVPLAYLPTEELEDLVEDASVGSGVLLGALFGGLFGGPPGAFIGGLVGGAGAAIIYDEFTEDIREPDLQDHWVHDRNQAELTQLLDELFDLAADVHGRPAGAHARAVFVLSGDVHVGAMHLIRSDRTGEGHDHRKNRLLYQLTSSPVSHDPPDSALLESVVRSMGSEVDLSGAEFLKEDPDRSAGTLGTRRFVLDSNGDEHYAAEFLGSVYERNAGRLVIENRGGRRYRFSSTIDGRADSLVTIFELDLDAAIVRPVDLIGQILQVEGVPIELRVNDVKGGFGPPSDRLDAEVVVKLDTAPGRAFGFPLREGNAEPAHRGMLDQLRMAFNDASPIRLDYERTGPNNGMVLRVISTSD